MEESGALDARRSRLPPPMPDEIIGEVLRRLPVAPLLRFRCVSKSWRSLIDSKQFIRMHLQHSLRSKSNRAVLVCSSELNYVDLDSFNRLEIEAASIQPYSVIASCDGLVLVSKYNDVALWNPSIRKMSSLPEPPPTPNRFSSYYRADSEFALGYDSKHDDYKVVRVIQACNTGGFSSDAAIYSLKSNSWKKTADFPYLLPYRNFTRSAWGVCLNDALHTVVNRSKDSKVIMAFDLGTEEHRELPMPQFRGGYDCSASVEVLDGILAAVFFRYCKSWRLSSGCEIWLMKEYGVGKSWMKSLQFNPPISARCTEIRPLAYSWSGEEVLMCHNGKGIRLKWYSLRKKRFERRRFNGLSGLFGPFAFPSSFYAKFCVASLVSPSSPSALEVEKKDRRMEKGKNRLR